jgi:hypothetical protein
MKLDHNVFRKYALASSGRLVNLGVWYRATCAMAGAHHDSLLLLLSTIRSFAEQIRLVRLEPGARGGGAISHRLFCQTTH